ncbi:MAG: NADH-quinone oxidoreductase subunit A [Cyclobacteriaceae bacterium]|nr:NADH-quinone oxidoreductase subunit A [Cyclobacteriaceae bacterium]
MNQAGSYFDNLANVLLFLVGGALFVTIALLVSRWIRPHRPNAEKNAPYESGETPVGSPWPQFNLRFYVIAILFILFEVEIVLIFPWATALGDKDLMATSQGEWGWFALAEMTLFVLILALGLAYAWVNGHLNWSAPQPRTPRHMSVIPEERYHQINERHAGNKAH